MITKDQITQLRKTFQKILSLPVSRSTFRELQKGIILATEGNKETANQILTFLFKGEVDSTENKNGEFQVLKKFIEDFSVPMIVSKDIFEKGEFISLITSDVITHPEHILFLNRIRRIDGDEFQFISDSESTVNLLNHFLGRFQELKKEEKTKKTTQEFRNQLITLRSKIEQLINEV